MLRVLANGVVLFSILFMPWWVTILAAIVFLLFYSGYEVVAWGVVADALYGAPLSGFLEFEFFFTLSALLFAIGAYILKQQLVFYTEKRV